MKKLLLVGFCLFLLGCQPNDVNQKESAYLGNGNYRFIDTEYNKLCYYTIRGGIFCFDLDKEE